MVTLHMPSYFLGTITKMHLLIRRLICIHCAGEAIL